MRENYICMILCCTVCSKLNVLISLYCTKSPVLSVIFYFVLYSNDTLLLFGGYYYLILHVCTAKCVLLGSKRIKNSTVQ